MTEENMNVAETEVEAQEVVQPEENQLPEDSQEKEISLPKRDFYRLRDTKKQLERENRELRARMAESERPPQPKEEDDLVLDDDDIVEGKVVKKLYNELRTLKKSYEQEKLQTIPDRLKTKFSDFEQVVTQENIEKLKQAEPELYASITSGSDLYAKSVSAYKTLKALGIVKDDPYVAQKEKAQSNASRPMSAQAIKGQGALSDANIFANGLTPDLKKQLQKEMQQAARSY